MSDDYYRGRSGLSPRGNYSSPDYERGMRDAAAETQSKTDDGRRRSPSSGGPPVTTDSLTSSSPAILGQLYEAWDCASDDDLDVLARPITGAMGLLQSIILGTIALGLVLMLRGFQVALCLIVFGIAARILIVPVDLILFGWLGSSVFKMRLAMWLAMIATVVLSVVTKELFVAIGELLGLLRMNSLILLVTAIWTGTAYTSFKICFGISYQIALLIGSAIHGGLATVLAILILIVCAVFSFFVAGFLTSTLVTKYGMRFL